MAGQFSRVPNLVFPIGRVTPNGVELLGSCFLLPKDGLLATAGHVVGQDDRNLVVLAPRVNDLDEYQDTSDLSVRPIPAILHAADPLHDLAIVKVEVPTASNFPIEGLDKVGVGDSVAIFGFPHANTGRMVLTQQTTALGAKILISNRGVKAKHCVLNIQARPGQSGSPVFRLRDLAVVAVLIGSYAPGGGGGISLGGVDPHTLHQTTHAVSAEYLVEMME